MAAKLVLSRLATPFYISRCRTLGVESVAPATRYTPAESNNSAPDSSREEESPKLSDKEIFEKLLRNSKLVSNGTFLVGQATVGQVVAIVNNHLYIDFGGKFYGVVPQTKDLQHMRKDSMVNVRVKDLEVTMHFLGAPKDSSLLEANIELVGTGPNKAEHPRVSY